MEHCETTSTVSTEASSNECRRVHFRDGLLPGWGADSDLEVVDLPNEWDRPLADWVYIDRDICGFSLHEYAPHSETKDFASSPYAEMFLEELNDIECESMFRQQSMDTCEEEEAAYRNEERKLDKALLMAGVHVNCIHAAPEDVQPSCEIWI